MKELCITPLIKKYVIIFSIIIVFLAVIQSAASAENIFLKNGSIYADVKIVSETDSFFTARLTNGREKRISRAEVLRINNIKLNPRKVSVHLRKKSVDEFSAYLVDKNETTYAFRKELNQPEEFSFKKTEIWYVAYKTIDELKAEGKVKTEVAFDVINTIVLIGTFAGLFFVFLLFRLKRGSSGANRILALWITIVSIVNTRELYFTSGLFHTFPHFISFHLSLSMLSPAVAYWYINKLTIPSFRLKPLHILHLVPFFYSAWYMNQHTILTGGDQLILLNNFYIPQPFDVFVWNIYLLQIFLYFVPSVVLLTRYRKRIKEEYSSIENISLKWLSFVIYTLFIINILLVICYVIDLSVKGFATDWNFLRKIWPLIYPAFTIIVGYKGVMQHEIFTDRHTSPTDAREAVEKTSLPPEKIREIIEKLTAVMNEKKPFLDPELTLPMLAEMVDVPRNYLSHAINESAGRNFYDYINALRVESAREILSNPDKQHRNILHIAFDAGFNTKATFNSAFKKNTGLTPSEFKRISLNRRSSS